MPTVTIPLTAVPVLSAYPNTRFGTPDRQSFTPSAWMLVRASLTTIPANAQVSSAFVQVWQHVAAWPGTQQILAKVASQPWSTATTWNTRPGFAGDAGSQERTDAAALSQWSIPVASTVQAWVSGVIPNNGLALYPPSSGTTLRGQTATSLRPQLVVTYDLSPQVPTGLRPSPGGVVSVPKPTLGFNVGAGTTSIQVQVDPSASSSSPAFDSGEVPATAGVYDLSNTPVNTDGSTPPYAGLSDAQGTRWRARAKNALGWSAWSAWSAFSRSAWRALTVNSPGSTVEDPSPTATASYAGTATSWRVQFLNASSTVVSDSQWQPGATIAYASTKAVSGSGTARFFVRDNRVRESTPGDPDYLLVDRPFAVSPSGYPASPISVSAASLTSASPVVRLTVTRAQIPDELVIYRAGVQVARMPGASVFTGTGPYTATWDDYTAQMNTAVVYWARAVVNGQFSGIAITAPFTPTCDGIWLLDVDSSSGVAIWTGDDQDQSQPELAALSRPIGGTGAVVRRRLARAPREGAVTGDLVDALGVSASASESLLRKWVDGDDGYDAGHVFRLVLGNNNDPVIVGDLEFSELPVNMAGQRVLEVSFNWWWQG